MSVFKAQAHIKKLKESLQITIPSIVISEKMDSEGFIDLTVTLGTEVALCKISMDGNAGRVDALGLPQRVYSPHIAKLLQDSDQTSADSKKLKARLVASLSKMGMKLMIKEDTKANIAAITVFDTGFTAASTVDTLPSDDINPLTISQ